MITIERNNVETPVYIDKGFISMAEIEYNNINRGNWGQSCRIEGIYYITPNNERYIIREEAHPVIDAETLSCLTYGKDYQMKNGFIILRDGSNWAMPRC